MRIQFPSLRQPTLSNRHRKSRVRPTLRSHSLREYDKLARQCAAEGLDARRFLLQLCELELLDRERRATERRIKAAKFPVTKTLDTFDFLVLPKLNKKLVLELARCEFIDRRQNVLVLREFRHWKNLSRLGAGTGGLPGRLAGSLHHRRGAGQQVARSPR